VTGNGGIGPRHDLSLWELKPSDRRALLLQNTKGHAIAHRRGCGNVKSGTPISDLVVETLWAGETVLREGGMQASRVEFCENCMCVQVKVPV